MKKLNRNAIFRGGCFVFVYLFLYFAPIAAIYSTRHMPPLIGNFCFSFPQLMFPFNIIYWKYHSLDGHTAFLISTFYLFVIAWLFSFLTRSVKNIRRVVLLAFCFSILSVLALNLALLALSIFDITVEPSMP